MAAQKANKTAAPRKMGSEAMSLRDPPPNRKTNTRKRIGTHVDSATPASGDLIRRDDILADLVLFFIEKLGFEVSFSGTFTRNPRFAAG
jgi:hypothetical protein